MEERISLSSLDILELGISTGAYKRFSKCGIKTVRDLEKETFRNLLLSYEIGSRAAFEAFVCLFDHGIRLKDFPKEKYDTIESFIIENYPELIERIKKWSHSSIGYLSGRRFNFVDLCENSEVDMNTIMHECAGETKKEKILAMTLDELDLSLCACRYLREAGIKTLGDLSTKTYDEVKQIKNLGKRQLEEIIDKLNSLGFCLNNNHCGEVVQPQEKTKTTDDSLFNFVSCGDGFAVAGFNGFDEKEIVIPDAFEGKPVKRILEGAFKDCDFIESVVLSKNISIIENSAFRSCHKLKSVKTSENLVFIGYNAFFECISLSNVILFDAVTFIGEGAFERTAIESFSVPKGLHFLSCGVFDGCEELKSVMFHDQLLTIGKDCFTNCKKLQHVVVPQSVRFIGDGAFVNCFALKDIEIHSLNAVIGKNVFSEICIYQPDLRYNIRTYYQPLKNICVKCLAGSLAQKYCRENNLRMTPLTNPMSNMPSNVSVDKLLAFKLSTFKKETIEIYKQRALQAGLVMEISTSFILATEIIVYLVNHTDYNEEKVKQILGYAENRSMFDEAITIKRISDHDIRPAWESV